MVKKNLNKDKERVCVQVYFAMDGDVNHEYCDIEFECTRGEALDILVKAASTSSMHGMAFLDENILINLDKVRYLQIVELEDEFEDEED